MKYKVKHSKDFKKGLKKLKYDTKSIDLVIVLSQNLQTMSLSIKSTKTTI